MKRWLAGLTAALALTAGPAIAQNAPRPSVAMEFRSGYLFAARDLGRTPVLEGFGYVAFDRLDPTPTLAVAIEASLFGPLAVRLMADHAFETGATGQWFCDVFVPCPAVLILVDGRVRRWSALADLRLRSGWGVGPFRPTVFLGFGRRAYRVRWDSLLPEVTIPTAYDRTSWFARAGVGAELARGPWALFAEADATTGGFGADAPPFFEDTIPPDQRGAGTRQLDVGLSVGVRLSLR